jgi:hypothetical protein
MNTLSIKDLKKIYMWDDLCDFIDKNYKDEYPSSCWNFTRYFRHLTNNDKNNENFEKNTNDISKLEDGIYDCHIDNNFEMHYFVLLINKNKIILMQTYGGSNKITIKEFDKSDWINRFNQIYDNNIYYNKYYYNYLINFLNIRKKKFS